MPATIIIPSGKGNVKPSALQKQAIFEDLSAHGKPNSADNNGNYHFDRWNVIVAPYLESPTGLTEGKAWFMLADSRYIKMNAALVWQERMPLSVRSYIHEPTDENRWKGRARFTCSPVDWKGIVAVIPGSGGTSVG